MKKEDSEVHQTVEPWTLTQWARKQAAPALSCVGRFMVRLGISANLLTLMGFLSASLAGLAAAMGAFRAGGALLILSGCFDVLDGTVARVTESETSFGAFLDSFLDRYSEGALLIGVVYWATCHGHHGLVILVFLTMLGSLMVSYARARAEGLGFSCKVGMFSRLERMIVLSATLLTGYLFIGFAALGFLTHATAFQRFFHVYKKTRA